MDYVLMIGLLFGIMTLADKRSFLDKETTILARNISTFFIILRHLMGQAEGVNPMTSYLCSNGFLYVGLFFLISGYGISLKNISKGNDNVLLIKSLENRIIKIVVPVVTSSIVMGIYYRVANRATTISLENLLGAKTFVPYSWYIYVIILFYIIATLSHMMNKKYAYVGQIMAVILYIVILYKCSISINICWYMSAAAFGIGCLFAYKNNLVHYIDAHKNFFICLSLVIYFIFYSYYNYPEKTSCLLQNITSIGYACFILLIASKLEINSKVQRLIGSIQYELYLFQGLSNYIMIDIFKKPTYFILALGTIIIDIAISICVSKINKSVILRLQQVFRFE